jgi:hypothetical protein
MAHDIVEQLLGVRPRLSDAVALPRFDLEDVGLAWLDRLCMLAGVKNDGELNGISSDNRFGHDDFSEKAYKSPRKTDIHSDLKGFVSCKNSTKR